MSSSPSSTAATATPTFTKTTTYTTNSPTKNKLNNLINLPSDTSASAADSMDVQKHCKRMRLSDSVVLDSKEQMDNEEFVCTLVHKSPKVSFKSFNLRLKLRDLLNMSEC